MFSQATYPARSRKRWLDSISHLTIASRSIRIMRSVCPTPRCGRPSFSARTSSCPNSQRGMKQTRVTPFPRPSRPNHPQQASLGTGSSRAIPIHPTSSSHIYLYASHATRPPVPHFYGPFLQSLAQFRDIFCQQRAIVERQWPVFRCRIKLSRFANSRIHSLYLSAAR